MPASDIVLSFAITPYDRVLPLLSGEVKPAGVRLEYQAGARGAAIPVPRIFYEQMKFQRFDVSEMSFSSYLVERAKGWPYVALPVFHNRNFRYTHIMVRRNANIRQDHPEDLKGKRFCVADYQMTMALWTRGILQHEFGVRPEDLSWYQTRAQRYSHTGASGTQLPEGVKLTFANADERSLLSREEVDATLPVEATVGEQLTTLFSNPKAEAIRFYQKTGIYPPHHLTVVRESILREHPWVALSLMEAFEDAKRLAVERLRNQSLLAFNQHYVQEERALLGADPHVYGVKANAKAIDMVQTISLEQGLTSCKAPLEQLFPEEVLIADEAAVAL